MGGGRKMYWKGNFSNKGKEGVQKSKVYSLQEGKVQI